MKLTELFDIEIEDNNITTKIYTESYLQEITLQDWQKNGQSWRTKHFYSLRKAEGNNKSVLRKIKWDKNNITLVFKTSPTYAKPGEKVKIISPTGTESLGNFYTVQIQFGNIQDELENWAGLTWKDKRSKVISWINVWDDIKFSSNDASWLYQGIWKRLDELDSSIYPYPGFPDSGEWERRHGTSIYVSKHIASIFPLLKFNVAEIIKEIDRQIGTSSKATQPKEIVEPADLEKEEPKVEPKAKEKPAEKKKETPKKEEPKEEETPEEPAKETLEEPKEAEEPNEEEEDKKKGKKESYQLVRESVYRS